MFFVLFSIMFISSVYSEKAILNDTRTKLMTWGSNLVTWGPSPTRNLKII